MNGLRAANPTTVPDYLSSISVRVKTPIGSSGSGIAFTRKDAYGKDVTYVWTAGHVCLHRETIPFVYIGPKIPMSKIRSVVPTEITYYTNLTVSQDVVINGKFAYTTNLSATLIKCSPDDEGNDLAVLRVNGKFFNNNKVEFDLSGRIPKLGEPLYAFAFPYGEPMFTTGMFSYVGRVYDDYVYDQSSLIVYPGSSGGGVFNENQKCVGLVMRMRGAGLNYIAPIRRMQEWAKEEGIEWALNSSKPMPSAEELKKIPLLDKETDECEDEVILPNPFKPFMKDFKLKPPALKPDEDKKLAK